MLLSAVCVVCLCACVCEQACIFSCSCCDSCLLCCQDRRDAAERQAGCKCICFHFSHFSSSFTLLCSLSLSVYPLLSCLPCPAFVTSLSVSIFLFSKLSSPPCTECYSQTHPLSQLVLSFYTISFPPFVLYFFSHACDYLTFIPLISFSFCHCL